MLKWHGRRFLRKVARNTAEAIDETMELAVEYAKANHPGWVSRSGDAEDSIQVIEKAHEEQGATVGRWGSKGIAYMLFLEFRRGRAMIRAADATYRQVLPKLRRRFRFTR